MSHVKVLESAQQDGQLLATIEFHKLWKSLNHTIQVDRPDIVKKYSTARFQLKRQKEVIDTLFNVVCEGKRDISGERSNEVS